MDDERGLSDGERMVRRAQQVAMGFAETGLTQAEEMLRRVSPEGRARAKRARAERKRRAARTFGRLVLALMGSLLILAVFAQLFAPLAAVAIAGAVMVALTLAILFSAGANAGPATPATLAASDLPALPAQAGRWLEEQRLALPAPAVRLADQLQQRLDGLAPQLAQLRPDEPAADAVRKLVATELPGLVKGYQAVPPSLRAVPRPDGRTPDAQLVDGLRLIDGEVARMTEQLARGAIDEVATQRRYLELKYSGEGGLG